MWLPLDSPMQVFQTHMALRLAFVLILLALSLVDKASAGGDPTAHWALAGRHATEDGGLSRSCNGLVGECIDDEEEMSMESEISRRVLWARRRYISYGALAKNKVPCNRRGQSYYNCGRHGRANPYRRGCSVITRCARDIN